MKKIIGVRPSSSYQLGETVYVVVAVDWSRGQDTLVPLKHNQ